MIYFLNGKEIPADKIPASAQRIIDHKVESGSLPQNATVHIERTGKGVETRVDVSFDIPKVKGKLRKRLVAYIEELNKRSYRKLNHQGSSATSAQEDYAIREGGRVLSVVVTELEELLKRKKQG